MTRKQICGFNSNPVPLCHRYHRDAESGALEFGPGIEPPKGGMWPGLE
jgi:hypothetical protein